VTIKKARAALSHSVFTGVSRNHLDRLVAELAGPFAAAREGRLHRRRGSRHRWPGAGHPQTLTLRDRVLCTLAWLRLTMPHQALAVLYGVDRSTISAAVSIPRSLAGDDWRDSANGPVVIDLALDVALLVVQALHFCPYARPVLFQQRDALVDGVIAGADEFGIARDIRDRHAGLA
jgi:Helix-turn-helix of DDE superfamily endonuclease